MWDVGPSMLWELGNISERDVSVGDHGNVCWMGRAVHVDFSGCEVCGCGWLLSGRAGTNACVFAFAALLGSSAGQVTIITASRSFVTCIAFLFPCAAIFAEVCQRVWRHHTQSSYKIRYFCLF